MNVDRNFSIAIHQTIGEIFRTLPSRATSRARNSFLHYFVLSTSFIYPQSKVVLLRVVKLGEVATACRWSFDKFIFRAEGFKSRGTCLPLTGGTAVSDGSSVS